MIREGKATARTAPLAVFVLLSRKAPELLVKNIPEEVKFGSHTWVSFSTAVARIEAQAPGSTSKMTFAQVMTRAEQIPLYPQEKLVEQLAQSDALKDWGIVNGILDVNGEDVYTGAQMDEVRNAFNKQVAELSAASTTLATQMPQFQKKWRNTCNRFYHIYLWKIFKINASLVIPLIMTPLVLIRWWICT